MKQTTVISLGLVVISCQLPLVDALVWLELADCTFCDVGAVGDQRQLVSGCVTIGFATESRFCFAISLLRFAG